MDKESSNHAITWYQNNKKHVEKLIKSAKGKHEPSGSDVMHPEL